jgi:hypothetical protein
MKIREKREKREKRKTQRQGTPAQTVWCLGALVRPCVCIFI